MTPTLLVSFFSCNKRTQRARKIGLHKHVANFRNLTVREKNPFRVGPLRKDGRARLDVLHAQFINRKSVGQLDCRLQYLTQRLRPKLIQRGHAGYVGRVEPSSREAKVRGVG